MSSDRNREVVRSSRYFYFFTSLPIAVELFFFERFSPSSISIDDGGFYSATKNGYWTFIAFILFILYTYCRSQYHPCVEKYAGIVSLRELVLKTRDDSGT